ncbi:hypothetical protein CB0940_11612 [Cercospora beticola]|uniref:IEC3 subunit of the Ino80 complex, chromatin re-modelling-domain-containing protein n=1 Tax=Cercospora beticola TaxID=122368 RepID=A0A2G5IEA6_CERBT|nr:hypothetical protein CB0940_11612 [Cercospora beticola]PIB03198.1 hypothetical protein CB0940_11612 [Cercospora beticola]WPB03955.1 hypothetical protein RHO25_008599 [Cercospora beticola]
MSDTEGHAAAAAPTQQHPDTGGKSLAAVGERARYKSYRKKYRKLRHKFDGVLEENKRLFKEEQKMLGTARRLREELDSVLEVLLDLNQNQALPTDLRFDVSLENEHSAVANIPSVVDSNISPTEANALLMEYTTAVQNGQIPHLDLHVIREQIDKKLARQGLLSLDKLEEEVSHARPSLEKPLPSDIKPDNASSYLTSQEEDDYLLRLDATLGDPVAQIKEKEHAEDIKHWADMTPREVERQTELQNPQSQHNWLKTHAKQSGPTADIDDNDSVDVKPARGAGAKRNLAKQVGDRSLGRAREGASPAASFVDDDEFGSFVDDHPKKRGRDPDSTYRIKGGKGSATNGKGKRKRSDETPNGSTKKARVEED